MSLYETYSNQSISSRSIYVGVSERNTYLYERVKQNDQNDAPAQSRMQTTRSYL